MPTIILPQSGDVQLDTPFDGTPVELHFQNKRVQSFWIAVTRDAIVTVQLRGKTPITFVVRIGTWRVLQDYDVDLVTVGDVDASSETPAYAWLWTEDLAALANTEGTDEH